MNKQLGFTLNELMICIYLVVCLALAGGALYAAVHFILKFW